MTTEGPKWPSLYNPTIELFHVDHHSPKAPGGHYLSDPNDVFRFTFLWTLIFYLPLFGICGTLAFLNILFPPLPPYPNPRPRPGLPHSDYNNNINEDDESTHQLLSFSSSPHTPAPADFTSSAVSAISAAATTSTAPLYPPPRPHTSHPHHKHRTPPRVNPQRTRIVYALLVLLLYAAAGVLGALVGAAIIGYILAGLYKAGNFNLSTWIPPLFALVQTLIGILGVYPSVVEII